MPFVSELKGEKWPNWDNIIEHLDLIISYSWHFHVFFFISDTQFHLQTFIRNANPAPAPALQKPNLIPDLAQQQQLLRVYSSIMGTSKFYDFTPCILLAPWCPLSVGVSKDSYSPRFTVDKIDFQGNPLHNQMQTEHPLAFRGALGNLGLNGGGLMSNNLLGNMQNQTWVYANN